MTKPEVPHPGARGALYALGAYSIWGVLPIYWKWLSVLPAETILSHRIVWSLLFSALLLSLTRRWGEFRAVLSGRATVVPLLASAVLIGGNWLAFIWAVNNERVVESSLGYYLTPLVNLAFGRIFLEEKLAPLQLVAVALAAIGVVQMALGVTSVPWIALFLAGSFGLYGLVRKVAPVAPVPGLAVETLLLTPLAVGWLAWLAFHGGDWFPTTDPTLLCLLLLSGVITATPLLFFAAAARRLPLSTLGFFQYIGPSLTLVVAVYVFGEPFTREQATAFAFIWAALALFSFSSVQGYRRARGATDPATEDGAPLLP